MTTKTYSFYIMASKTKVLYFGVTGDLNGRVWEHKNKITPGFTQKYNVTTLVYYEDFYDVLDAIAREKQIKKWKRSKKIQLIERDNKEWEDLSQLYGFYG